MIKWSDYPKNFLDNYACSCMGKSKPCNCSRKAATAQFFLDRVELLVESVQEIMTICHIPRPKVKAAYEVLIRLVENYMLVLLQINEPRTKRLRRKELMKRLGKTCDMTFLEAQLTYNILVRAFKAFYYNTDESGLPDKSLEEKSPHTSECMWLHAAQCTAHMFANYQGMLKDCQQNYEMRIKCVYKQLYDKLKKRHRAHSLVNCHCDKCTMSTAMRMPSENEVFTLSTFMLAGSSEHSKAIKPAEHVELEKPCNCKKLKCYWDVDVDVPCDYSLADASAGPFQCRWELVENVEDEDEAIDPCVRTIDEPESSDICEIAPKEPCESFCKCDCNECECESSFDVEMEMQEAVEDHELEATETASVQSMEYVDCACRRPRKRFDYCRTIKTEDDSTVTDDLFYMNEEEGAGFFDIFYSDESVSLASTTAAAISLKLMPEEKSSVAPVSKEASNSKAEAVKSTPRKNSRQSKEQVEPEIRPTSINSMTVKETAKQMEAKEVVQGVLKGIF